MSTPDTASPGRLRSAGRAATRHARRVAIAVIGGTVLAVGAAMLVLPGPGLVVLIVGLGILGVEFAWARELQHRARHHATALARRTPGLRRATTRPGTAEDVRPRLADASET